MQNVEYNVLKKKFLNNYFYFLNSTRFNVEIRLLRPAISPFFLVRLDYVNKKEDLYSIHIVNESNDNYFYLNFPYDENIAEGQRVELFVVFELDLSIENSWAVYKKRCGGNSSFVCRIYRHYSTRWLMKDVSFFVKYQNKIMLKWKKEYPVSADFLERLLFGPKNYGFIGGSPKSGTSWVTDILNVHNSILSVGENSFVSWPSRESLKDLMVSEPPPSYAFAVPKKLDLRSQMAMMYMGRALHMMRQLGACARVKTVIDKTPNYGDHALEILELMPEAKYVHVVRHPLDVLVSRYFHERDLLIQSRELSILCNMPDIVIEKIINFNRDDAKLGEIFDIDEVFDILLNHVIMHDSVHALMEDFKEIYLIRYEDLKENFSETVHGLYQFFGYNLNAKEISKISEITNFDRKKLDEAKTNSHLSGFYRQGTIGDFHKLMTKEQINFARQAILKHSLAPWTIDYLVKEPLI